MTKKSILQSSVAVALAFGALTACGKGTDNLSVATNPGGVQTGCPAGQVPNFYTYPVQCLPSNACIPGMTLATCTGSTAGYNWGWNGSSGCPSPFYAVGSNICRYDGNTQVNTSIASMFGSANGTREYQLGSYYLDGDTFTVSTNNLSSDFTLKLHTGNNSVAVPNNGSVSSTMAGAGTTPGANGGSAYIDVTLSTSSFSARNLYFSVKLSACRDRSSGAGVSCPN